jgi:zinc protease
MKKTNLLFTLALCCVLAGCNGSKAGYDLKFEKYTLDNGLQVVLHQDKSDPIVSVALAYHVGSSFERPGKTGFAHLFEHLMFQRSENLGRNEYLNKINEMGGSFNGGTSLDYTTYFETVPRDALEKALWMESDRLGFFINTVSQAGLEREIDVVSNEKRQGENGAYGKSNSIELKNYYPEGHPYSWPVIGYIKDLRSNTLDDVREFYNQFYSPSNATLAIAGDFDVAEAKKLVEKYFGEIKAHGEPEPVEPELVTLDGNKTLFYTDDYATAPKMEVRYPAVQQFHPDSYPLRILSLILSNGKNSPMQRVLVTDKKLASWVNMAYAGFERDGFVSFTANAFSGTKLDDVAAAAEEAFALFEKEGVNAAELEKAKTLQETMVYNLMTTVENKAQNLARNNSLGSHPDQSFIDLAAYQKVTAKDVMRVYDKYVKGKNRFTFCAVPVKHPELAITGAEQVYPVQDTYDVAALTSGNSIEDDDYPRTPSAFDRSVEPALLPNTPHLSVRPTWNATLSNGVKVTGMVYDELPVTEFMILFNRGKLADPDGKIGLAAMTASMMNAGTALKTPEELSSLLGQLGARVAIGANDDAMYLKGSCIDKNFEKVMDIVAEMILQPRWDENELEIVRTRFLNSLMRDKENTQTVAQNALGKVLFGADSRLAMSRIGTEQSIKAFTMDDLKAFYAEHLFSDKAVFSYVGPRDAESMSRAVEKLAQNWKLTSDEPVGYEAPAEWHKPEAKIYFIDYPGAMQSYVMLGRVAMPLNSAEYYPAVIVNHALGASSASELFRVLRLQKGYTYGAYSGFYCGEYDNRFRARSSVQSAYTLESMQLMRDILKGYGDSFTQEVLDDTKVTMSRKMLASLEAPDALLDMLSDVSVYGLPTDFIVQREKVLNDLTLAEAHAAITEWLDYDDMVFVVVGDAAKHLDALKKSGLGKVAVMAND